MNETLEDLLRQACERGITHLTMWPTPSEDGKLMYWRAQGTPSTGHKYVSVTALDPIEALRGCLIGLPKAPKRAAPKQVDVGHAPDLPVVTAAVTETLPPPNTLDDWLPKA